MSAAMFPGRIVKPQTISFMLKMRVLFQNSNVLFLPQECHYIFFSVAHPSLKSEKSLAKIWFKRWTIWLKTNWRRVLGETQPLLLLMFVTNWFCVCFQLHGMTHFITGYTDSAVYNELLNASDSYWMNITASPSSDKTLVCHQEHKLWDNIKCTNTQHEILCHHLVEKINESEVGVILLRMKYESNFPKPNAEKDRNRWCSDRLDSLIYC